jgi:hypothetical protein
MANKTRKDLSTEDELRLVGLNMASVAFEREKWGPGTDDRRDKVLRVLEEIREEANETFARAKREVGLTN